MVGQLTHDFFEITNPYVENLSDILTDKYIQPKYKKRNTKSNNNKITKRRKASKVARKSRRINRKK